MRYQERQYELWKEQFIQICGLSTKLRMRRKNRVLDTNRMQYEMVVGVIRGIWLIYESVLRSDTLADCRSRVE